MSGHKQSGLKVVKDHGGELVALNIFRKREAHCTSIPIIATVLAIAAVGCGHSSGMPPITGGYLSTPEQQREAVATQWFHEIAAGNLKAAMAQSYGAGGSAVIGFSQRLKEHGGAIASLTYHDTAVHALDATVDGSITFSDGHKFIFRMIQMDVDPKTFKANGRWLVFMLQY